METYSNIPTPQSALASPLLIMKQSIVESWRAHLTLDTELLAICAAFFVGYFCLGYFDATLPLSESVIRQAGEDTLFIHHPFTDKAYYVGVLIFCLCIGLRMLHGASHIATNMNHLVWRTLFVGLGLPFLLGIVLVGTWSALPEDIQQNVFLVLFLEASLQDTLSYGGAILMLLAFCAYALAQLSFLLCVIADTGKIGVKRALLLSKGHVGPILALVVGGIVLGACVAIPLGFLGALDSTSRINPAYTGPAESFLLMNTWFWDNTFGQALLFATSSFITMLPQSFFFGTLMAYYKRLKEKETQITGPRLRA
ncbi:MAG: hypothetical protein C0514_06865 [Candidatus Puniceispirillum sp.]|nr:hypothetical protein [Candidatus Puniceispirillum sp.]